VRTLVIGYGNELRGDDSLGPRIARAVADWRLEGVRCLDLHQLTPELVDEMAGVDRVVFIDARQGAGAPVLQELTGAGGAPAGHVSDPRGLLALCQVLHGRAPRAWLLTVGGECFEIGAGLSAGSAEGLRQALALVRALLA
jgi:hydrogenase maturation protease